MAPMTEHEHTVDGRSVRHSHETLSPEARTRVRTIPHEARAAAIAEARRRFGGIDVPASLTGMLVAIGLIVVIGGILAAIVGSIAFTAGAEIDGEEATVGALVAGGATLFVAFLIAGWTAGRASRYAGWLNGMLTGVWFLVLMGILAGLGAWVGDRYNLFDEFMAAKAALPNWYSDQAVTAGAIGSTIGGIAMILVGGLLGGLWGERLHRRADAALVDLPESELVREDVHAHPDEHDRTLVGEHDDDRGFLDDRDDRDPDETWVRRTPAHRHDVVDQD